MLNRTFILFDRITATSEQKLFSQGIHTWQDFLQAKTIKGISKQRKTFYDLQIRRAQAALQKKDWTYFSKRLSSTDMWRLYLELRDECCYLDIEAQGKNILLLGVYADDEYIALLQGKTLSKELFLDILKKFPFIVTFNGTSFDIPLIERYFGISLKEYLHFDVRHAAKKIGLVGGLKNIEKKLNIRRESVISGKELYGLFKHYLATQNEDALRSLLHYNEEDCKNLESLCHHVCKVLEKKTFNSTQKK
ncbi:hypothetical protein D6774_00165 [Candidatus Woesearchaeota archaeon]|nr:MAG: hypothetical protein D6774_00165 [Candidatus Woesearchaeota archaeon]